MAKRRILGLSALYHDSAACLLEGGEIVAAAQEERFSRRKFDARFPREAISYCLREGGISERDLDAVAYYDKPVETFGRVLQSYLEYPLRSFRSFRSSAPRFTQEKLRIPRLVQDALPGFRGELLFLRHHESHAASAFFCSPFQSAAILVADGVGEWASASIGIGEGDGITLVKSANFPHSLGLFYSAMTQYLGFRPDSDEYKVMGLAPYGEARFVKALLREVIDLKQDGSVALNLEYFDFPFGLKMVNGKLGKLLGQPARKAGDRIEKTHMDVAASTQAIAADAMIRLARHARSITGKRNLCLAGGVALNCVANGRIHKEGIFDDIYIQPAAGDAGGAIGAAFLANHRHFGEKRPGARHSDKMKGAFLGPGVSASDAASFLEPLPVERENFAEEELAGRIARWISEGRTIACCRGRMEFGPRALGARSILADPRDPSNRDRINRAVKFRESYRPFACAILDSEIPAWFGLSVRNPYMLVALPIRNGSEVPAVAHVDDTSRLQSVDAESNPFLHRVLEEFKRITGCPMLLNTSFNLDDEPIVRDCTDAYRSFWRSGIDILVLGNTVIRKPELKE